MGALDIITGVVEKNCQNPLISAVGMPPIRTVLPYYLAFTSHLDAIERNHQKLFINLVRAAQLDTKLVLSCYSVSTDAVYVIAKKYYQKQPPGTAAASYRSQASC